MSVWSRSGSSSSRTVDVFVDVLGPERVRRLWFPWLVVATVAVGLALRLVNLDQLPGEVYGDIAIVYEYLHGIRAGRWPTSFVLSAGPLYQYLITPVIWLTGLNYWGLKLASVLVSLGVLGGTYALARELLDDELALIAMFVAGVSSWLLVFSRLGNLQILVPLLTVGALYFAVRIAKWGRRADVVACAVVSALGLYVYPPSFVLAPVVFATLLCLTWTRTGVRRGHLLLFALVSLLGAVPFLMIVAKDPANFSTGYIGSKWSADANLPGVLLGNVRRGLLALHVRGDGVFRSNPVLQPHLDVVSGVLFLLGVVFWLWPGRWQWSPVLLVPFFLLQLPSMLVLSQPGEVPSASRTLGIAPIAYLLVASGLWWVVDSLRAFRWPARLVLLGSLATILLLNAQRYFRTYADGLPNHNTPFGRIIADYIDGLPPETTVYVVGCCWGDWGQPEPKGIQYVVRRPQSVHFLETAKLHCGWFRGASRPAVVIWSPAYTTPAPQLSPCADALRPELHTSPRGGPVFHSSHLEPIPPALRR